MVSEKKLIIYTLSYPYGAGEQFITPELNVLSKHFSEVILIPENPSGDILKSLPGNVRVITSLNGVVKPSLTDLLFNFLAAFTTGKKRITHFRYLFSLFKTNYRKALQLQKLFSVESSLKNSIHFSYWFYNWATVLAILKQKGIINNFYSRAHGFDLYDERSGKGFIPFREFQLKHVAKVFAVSKNGTEYLKKKFPGSENKITYHPMGTVKQEGNLFQKTNSSRILIVSCSLLLKLKRIDLLADALKKINIPIHWVHFGDGPEKDKIKKIISGFESHITVELIGNTPNEQIMSFYKNNFVDFFINVSEYEGLPVSIMEAISHGIPVIASDVGGTHEIVNETTGKLIPKDISVDSLAQTIAELIINKETFNRKEIIDFWEQNFSAENNGKKLIEQLICTE